MTIPTADAEALAAYMTSPRRRRISRAIYWGTVAYGWLIIAQHIAAAL